MFHPRWNLFAMHIILFVQHNTDTNTHTHNHPRQPRKLGITRFYKRP
jgi:hypothetical protein